MSFTIVSRDLIMALSDAATALFLNRGAWQGGVTGKAGYGQEALQGIIGVARGGALPCH